MRVVILKKFIFKVNLMGFRNKIWTTINHKTCKNFKLKKYMYIPYIYICKVLVYCKES